MLLRLITRVDWDDSATELLNLKGGPPGAAKSGGDRLWEDNWDDDDIEEDFNLQLRYEAELRGLKGHFSLERSCL